MHKFVASLLVLVILGTLFVFPVSVRAQLFGPLPAPGSTELGRLLGTRAGTSLTSTAGGFKLIAFDPTSLAIAVGIQLFLTLFGSKLSCLFGSEKDVFAAGLTPQTVVQNSAYDNIMGVKSLTDTTGPFGGQILGKEKCKCGAKFGVKEVMMIGPPKRTMVAVTSGTKVYDYRSFGTGNWVLGKSTAEVVCRIPKALRIAEIGTSR